MATINTPKVNKIIRMTEFDLLRTSIVQGNMYICTDSLNMYYDESTIKRSKFSYVGIKTVNDIMYNTTPTYGLNYYCWEDNSLWVWMNKWITVWSDSKYPSAYIYTDYPATGNTQTLNAVYSEVLDNNGLLGDGSVVIRDKNRIIKGKIYVNDDNDNLTVSSYLGGGIRFLPNGLMDTDGEFLIGDEGKSFLRSELSIYNNEAYIDYKEKPQDDPALPTLKRNSHRYKIFHEGNLDASLIKEITGEEIYQKLLTDKSLPDTLDLNVKYLNGKQSTDFANKVHTHTVANITDFAVEARKQADIEIKTVMNNLAGDGVTITPDSTTNTYKLSADSFTLSFGGGVRGSKVINHLSDTTINLTVDPSQHLHNDYVARMNDLQRQLNEINAMDKNDYYIKSQVDDMITGVSGTITPTPGKPLLVNNESKLDVGVTSADKLSNTRVITFSGDITGSLTTDFSKNENVLLDASKILSTTPTAGKALKVDINGNLPANAESSSKLDHKIQITLADELQGTGTLDTSKTSFTINAKLKPNDTILQTKDLGVTVVPLNSDKKIPEDYLPVGANGALSYVGQFNPNDGVYPSENPLENEYWVASVDGTFYDEPYIKGDWLVYQNGQWTGVHLTNTVKSVNGYTGIVNLDSYDVGAISATYIDYVIGDEIPAGKVVRTSVDGVISGASIEKLSNEFSIMSTTDSDIVIANSASTINKTDGSSNVGLKMSLSDKLKAELDTKYQLIFTKGDTELPHTKYINLSDKFTTSRIGEKTYLDIQDTTKGFSLVIDGDENSIVNVHHNLGTKQILVQFREEASGNECFINNKIVDENNLEINFNNVITSGSIRVNIIAF